MSSEGFFFLFAVCEMTKGEAEMWNSYAGSCTVRAQQSKSQVSKHGERIHESTIYPTMAFLMSALGPCPRSQLS